MSRIPLCILSRASLLSYEHADCHRLDECPLGLSNAEATRCLCKTRKVVGRTGSRGPSRPQQIQVLCCMYPSLYSGERIKNEDALVAWIKQQTEALGPLR
jgi:hypothetical protein